jgi:hypothetical protein
MKADGSTGVAIKSLGYKIGATLLDPKSITGQLNKAKHVSIFKPTSSNVGRSETLLAAHLSRALSYCGPLFSLTT